MAEIPNLQKLIDAITGGSIPFDAFPGISLANDTNRDIILAVLNGANENGLRPVSYEVTERVLLHIGGNDDAPGLEKLDYVAFGLPDGTRSLIPLPGLEQRAEELVRDL